MKSLAYLNGEYVAPEEMTIPVTDAGFVMGVTIAEQLRTFRGKPFRINEHLDRLCVGLEITGGSLPLSVEELVQVIHTVTDHNWSAVDSADDIGITVFVTPGPYRTYQPEGPFVPSIGVHTYPLPFSLWAKKYKQGQRLVVSPVQQISPESWPFAVKCRSRMHYFLATHAATKVDVQASPLLLDADGVISETPVANVVAYFADRGFIAPPRESMLEGVSLLHLQDIARRLNTAFDNEPLQPQNLLAADAVFVTSTPFCVLPVSSLDGQAISSEVGRTMYERILAAWSNDVGVDIAAQANQFARRESRS